MPVQYIYSLTISVVRSLFKFMNRSGIRRALMRSDSKFSRFVELQDNAMDAVLAAGPFPEDTVWIHCASLGEYRVASPILRSLKQKGYNTLLTLFSPSAYDVLIKESSENRIADHIFLLPLDTRKNARKFINGVRPHSAIFIISEIWPNYVKALKEAGIPAYLTSALIHGQSAVTKWYGGIFRQTYKSYNKVLVLDKLSAARLRDIGVTNVEVSGDPLFDNARKTAELPYENPILAQFCMSRHVLVGGSISDVNDLQLFAYVVNQFPDDRFVIVPHDIRKDVIDRIRKAVRGRCALYTECDELSDLEGVQVLIIDYVGDLSKLYRYCAYAYVGGGFTPLLHSVIEPAVYGLPVSFGPKIHRKNTPLEMINLGIGEMVSSGPDLSEWYGDLRGNPVKCEKINATALNYIKENCGATSGIVDKLGY